MVVFFFFHNESHYLRERESLCILSLMIFCGGVCPLDSGLIVIYVWAIDIKVLELVNGRGIKDFLKSYHSLISINECFHAIWHFGMNLTYVFEHSKMIYEFCSHYKFPSSHSIMPHLFQLYMGHVTYPPRNADLLLTICRGVDFSMVHLNPWDRNLSMLVRIKFHLRP